MVSRCQFSIVAPYVSPHTFPRRNGLFPPEWACALFELTRTTLFPPRGTFRSSEPPPSRFTGIVARESHLLTPCYFFNFTPLPMSSESLMEP